MKPATIPTSLRSITLSYENDNELSAFENELIKQYVALHEQTSEALRRTEALRISITELYRNALAFREELNGIKTTYENLQNHAEANLRLATPRQDVQHDILLRQDVLNVSLKAIHDKIIANESKCRIALDELELLEKFNEKLCGEQENPDDEKSSYEVMDEMVSLLLKDENKNTIDVVKFDDDWQEFLGIMDTVSKEEDKRSEEWDAFLVVFNPFIKEYNIFNRKMGEQSNEVLEEEEKEEWENKQKILLKREEEVPEHIKEVVDHYEKDLKYGTRSYYDTDDWNHIFEYYAHFNELEKMNAAMESALEQHPGESTFILRKAQQYVTTHDYNKALELVKEVEAKGPPYHPALPYAKATINEQMQMPKQAIKYYKQAIATCTDDTAGIRRRAYLNCAYLYEKQNQISEGISLLKECMSLNRHNEKIVEQLASFYEQNKQAEKAVNLLNDFLQKNPGFISTWLALGNLYWSQKDHKKAIETFDHMITLEPGCLPALMNKAEILRHMESYEEALKCCETVIATHPPDAQVLVCAGWNCESIKRYEDAKKHYHRALQIDPDYALAIQGLQRLNNQTEK